MIKNKYNVSKIKESLLNGKVDQVKLVGQPIFKQMMHPVSKADGDGLICRHESDYCHMSIKTRTN
jgi:hypothetical protein